MNTVSHEPLVQIACDFVYMYLLSWSQIYILFLADYLKKKVGHFKFKKWRPYYFEILILQTSYSMEQL